MAKIVRYNGNLVPFASASLGTERTIFGDVTQADDITSQFTSDFLRGWGIVGPSDQPTLQDFNAVGYTHGQILAYLHQIGIAEYNATQEYHLGSFANVSGVLYVSLINNNTGNAPAASPAQWKSLAANGFSVFIASGSFTVPEGVTSINVLAAAGGGGGGGGADNSLGQTSLVGGGGGGGGGAGESILWESYAVTPLQVISITIGTGGSAGAAGVGAAGGAGGNGGNTVIGSLVTLTAGTGGGGGLRPVANSLPNGGAGASGGNGFPAGATGTDGNYTGNGGQGASCPCGGGGGSGRAATAVGIAGRPGSGFGSGGGGGGAGYGSAAAVNGGAGGAGASGVVIIRW